jgi:hypothetical protein
VGPCAAGGGPEGVHAPHDLHGLGALVVVEARARARGAPICGLPRGGGCALLHRVSQGLEAGVIQKPPAPAIAINYWRLPANARLKGVVTVVRADKVHHHDVEALRIGTYANTTTTTSHHNHSGFVWE